VAFTKVNAGGAAGVSVGTGGSANAANPAGGGGIAGKMSGWHPTVLYMLGLIIAEILLVGFLSRHLFGGGE
jgi:hypothetical protein